MQKTVFLFAGLIILTASVFGQKTLKVTERDLSTVIFRCAGDNETVVEVQSNTPLTFESTMDKEITFCDTIAENGFFFYQLKFKVEKKYSGRKLKIKGYGFETHTQPLDLQAKVPVGLLVLDLDSDVGVGCYFEHLTKGNKFFANTQYADAKSEYYQALECSEVPENNDVSKKIEDAGTCLDAKRAADNFYNTEKFDEALKDYEKVSALNRQDVHVQERITACRTKLSGKPRIIRGKITDENGNALANLKIEAEVYDFDKKGNIVLDKDGAPKKKKFLGMAVWAQVGTTDAKGNYEVTVKVINDKLRFSKPVTKYCEYLHEAPITDNNMNLTLARSLTLEGTIEQGKRANDARKAGKIDQMLEKALLNDLCK